MSIRLLSDADKKVMHAYGVWQPKKIYGKESYGIVRSTFLIGPTGKIARVWSPVNVKGHAEEVLNSLSLLLSSGN